MKKRAAVLAACGLVPAFAAQLAGAILSGGMGVFAGVEFDHRHIESQRRLEQAVEDGGH